MIKKTLIIAAIIFFSSTLTLGNQSMAGTVLTLDQKLQQCEAAFKAAHSENATRRQVVKAREQHLALMVEILADLNKINLDAVEHNKALSTAELGNSVRVMGHLMGMLAKDHMTPEQEWSYLY